MFKRGMLLLGALCLFCLVDPAAARKRGIVDGTEAERTTAGAVREAQVVACLDGDTIRLNTGERVRLARIDTPELSTGNNAQYFAAEAARRTRELVKGQRVRVRIFPGETSHKRVIGEVLLADGRSLNEVLVAEGLAFYLSQPKESTGPHAQELVHRLRAAQNRAIDGRRGFWAGLADRAAPGPYVGNPSSGRFFTAECLKKTRAKPKRLQRFSSLEDAFREGFSPARPCDIWPEAPRADELREYISQS